MATRSGISDTVGFSAVADEPDPYKKTSRLRRVSRRYARFRPKTGCLRTSDAFWSSGVADLLVDGQVLGGFLGSSQRLDFRAAPDIGQVPRPVSSGLTACAVSHLALRQRPQAYRRYGCRMGAEVGAFMLRHLRAPTPGERRCGGLAARRPYSAGAQMVWESISSLTMALPASARAAISCRRASLACLSA